MERTIATEPCKPTLSCHAARFESPPSCFTGVIRLRFNQIPVRPTSGSHFKLRTYCSYKTGNLDDSRERPLLLPNVTAALASSLLFSSLPVFSHPLDPIAIRVPKSPLPLIRSALKFLISYDGLRAAGKGIPRPQIFRQLRRRHLRIHRPPPPQIVSQLIMPFLYILGFYLSFLC